MAYLRRVRDVFSDRVPEMILWTFLREPSQAAQVEVSPMDFDRVQADWVLGRFPKDQLPEVAAQAMMAGFEGPFILDLVGYAAPSLHQLTADVVEGAFREMGRPPITEQQAAMRLARLEALRILRKQTSCSSGAGVIADLARLLEYEERPPLLDKFVELFWEEESWTDRQREFEQRVVELAWALLEADLPGGERNP